VLALKEPGKQSVHWHWPINGCAVLMGHDKHAVLPVVFWNVPGAHESHALRPVAAV
jgi:hypothetical protein